MIIYGVRRRNKVLGQMEIGCAKCQKPTMQTVVRTRPWMTLFFIPVFPIGKNTTSRCNLCGLQMKVQNAQADQWFPKQPAAPAR
jgi:hypothetical protein